MKNLFSFFLMFFLLNMYGQGKYQINLEQENMPVKYIAGKGLSFMAESRFSRIDFLDISTKEGNFVEVTIPGAYASGIIGSPKLPQVKRLIEIPLGASAKVSIVSYDIEEYQLRDLGITNKIIPVQPSLSKSDDPDKVKFRMNKEIYSKDEYIETPLAQVQYVGQMRSVRLGRLVISPVQYNPSSNSLKVYKNIRIRVDFENADISKTTSLKKATYSPLFESNFKSLLNYSGSLAKQTDEITQYPIKYVIISDRMFESTLAPFIAWKTKKGFNVITAYTDVIGTTTTSIKSYLQNLYNSGTATDPAPTFVLFVGDVDQVPAFSASGHVTDLRYCEYTGDDIPEVYYGRFSAENVAELQSQIDKTLEYEQYTMPDPGFLHEAVLVSGADPNFAPINGNGQINYGATYYFNAEHNINAHVYLYPASETSDEAVRSDIAAGCSFANYTAHCSADGWADPTFSISHIASMTNAHEYPLMIGNCCQSSKFEGDCFAEEILRASNKGAVGYIGGSDYTYWDEDYYFGVGVGTVTANPTYESTGLGAYDRAFHDHNEDESDWFVTNAQVLHAGNLAVTEGGTSLVTYYWEIYHLMGDPSVMNYFSVPSALTASYPSSMSTSTTSLTITSEPYSYVALSKNNVLLDAKYTGTGTQATLTFDAIAGTGIADIVITKQNRAPYIGTIDVTGSEQPPVAAFSASPTTVTVGGNVQFTDNSSNLPTSYSWSFPGGTPSTGTSKNPLVTYNTTGTFPVSLTVTNAYGTDTETKTAYITVNLPQAPVADFTASQTVINVGNSVSFTDKSTNDPTSWSWTFEGGTPSSSTEQAPTVQYNSSGTYSVSLSASNSSGEDTKTKTGYIVVNIQSYCGSKGNNSNYEWIKQVQVGNYSNTSGAAGYTDFTSEIINISTGSTAVSLTPGFSSSTYNEYWKIWIDLNVDGDFTDANELVFDAGSLSSSAVSGNLTIPGDYAGITSRMRVSMKYNNTQTSCETFSYGEVEDYTVKISEAKGVEMFSGLNKVSNGEFILFPNPVKDYLTIHSGTHTSEIMVKVYDITGVLVKEKILDAGTVSLNVTDLNSGVYIIQLDSSFKQGRIKFIKQ